MQSIQNSVRGHSGLYGAVTSRAEAQVVRLSLIYALLDCSPVIRQEHLLAALALWEYCEALLTQSTYLAMPLATLLPTKSMRHYREIPPA